MLQKSYTITFVVIVFIILFPLHCIANRSHETRIPDATNPGVSQLLELVDSQKKLPPDMDSIEKVLDFIASDKKDDTLYYTQSRSGAPSAYDEFELNQNLKTIMQYAYNPDIPAVVCSPSSVRLSSWSQINGEKKPLPKLWEHLDSLSAPIIIHGVERIENTPDLSSGAYFEYDLLRTLILLKHQGRNVLISMSSQKEVSDVGKKGLVLGSDDEWSYLYTGEAGLTKNGLGWVKSYIYSSASIIVYMESEESPSKVRCGVFKWIRAGWAGINMVNKRHIKEGIERFAKAFKQIVENPNMPNPAYMASLLSRVPTIPTGELRDLTWAQLQQFKKQYGKMRGVSNLLTDKQYVENLTRLELESFVVKEYVKSIITNDDAQPVKNRFKRMENASRQMN